MDAQISNGALRELVAERDYLKQRNISLSESLDANAAKYRSILLMLGFDAEGNTLPKEPSGEPAEPTGVLAVAPAEEANEQPSLGQEDPVRSWADKQAANDAG